jgi:hypothetical protein
MRTRLVRGPESNDGGQASTLIAIATFVAALAIVVALVDTVDNNAPFATFLSQDNGIATVLGNGGEDLPPPAESSESLASSGLPALPQVGDGPIGAPATTSPLMAIVLLGAAAALPVAGRLATAPRVRAR